MSSSGDAISGRPNNARVADIMRFGSTGLFSKPLIGTAAGGHQDVNGTVLWPSWNELTQ